MRRVLGDLPQRTRRHNPERKQDSSSVSSVVTSHFSAAVLGCLIASFAAAVLAQEGHPLVGTWYGDWGPSPQERHDVTIIMTWDGKTIGGTIDPGPDAVPIKTATLDSSTWTVHIEAERPDKAPDKAKTGAAVRYVIDGKLSNLGSYNRTLTGTWTQGTSKGDFKLTRD
jgi:hypothetical protein